MRPAAPVTLVMAVAVVALGVVLRLLGFFDLELWSDEAEWCKRLLDGNYGWIRPVGYMWVTRQLLAIESNEHTLRALSYVAGILQLPLLFLALRRMVVTPVIAVFGTYLLAINPIAVAMTKEFKPYALESCLHTLLLVLTLAYLSCGHARWVVAVVVTALVAPLFAWTIIFAYPGVFTVIGLAALKEGRFRHFAATAVGCAATVGVLLVLFSARLADKKPDTGYWGKKYDVFYTDHNLVEQLQWLGEKTADIATFPAQLEWFWPARGTLGVVCIVMCALGVVAIVVRKQWRLAALMAAPWAIMAAFNLAGMWPYGRFRTNVFLIFYTVGLVVLGVDGIARAIDHFGFLRRWRRPLAVVGVTSAVALFPFHLTAFRHKGPGTLTAEASVRKALERIYEMEGGVAPGLGAPPFVAESVVGPQEGAVPAESAFSNVMNDAGFDTPLLVLDGHACALVRYYRLRHDDSRALLGDFMGGFVTKCGRSTQRSWQRTLARMRGRSFWLISAKSGWVDLTRGLLAPYCTAAHDEEFPGSTLLYRCEPRAELPADGQAN